MKEGDFADILRHHIPLVFELAIDLRSNILPTERTAMMEARSTLRSLESGSAFVQASESFVAALEMIHGKRMGGRNARPTVTMLNYQDRDLAMTTAVAQDHGQPRVILKLPASR